MAGTGINGKNSGHVARRAPAKVERGEGLSGGKRLEGLALLRAGSKVTLTNVGQTLKRDGRFVPANLLTVIGALAGFSGQIAVREILVDTGRRREDEVFVIRRTGPGTRWFEGQQVEDPLVYGPMSLWGLASGTARELGARTLPDPAQMSARQTALVRASGYGRAEVDPRHRATVETLAWLRAHWAKFRAQADRYCAAPVDRTLFFSLMAQEALMSTRDAMPAETGLRILMESAFAWSRLDPQRLAP